LANPLGLLSDLLMFGAQRPARLLVVTPKRAAIDRQAKSGRSGQARPDDIASERGAGAR